MHNVIEYTVDVTKSIEVDCKHIPESLNVLINTLLKKVDNFSIDFSVNQDDGYLTIYCFFKGDINMYKLTAYIYDDEIKDFTTIIPKKLLVSALNLMNNTINAFVTKV